VTLDDLESLQQHPDDGQDEPSVDFTPIAASPEPEPAAFSYPLRIALYAVIIAMAAAMAWMVVVRTEDDLPAAASARTYLPPPRAPLSEAEFTIARTLDAARYYQPPAESQPDDEPATDEVTVADDAAETAQDGAAAADAEQARHQTRRRGFHPSAFKLSAIIDGPSGPTAIINGRFVQVGSTVYHAEVVRIARGAVQLRIDGQTYTLRP